MTEETLDGRITHKFADLSDVRLHYVEGGEGQLVVLLHGFPEFWYAWKHQIIALIDAGYRVVAPDMRGYNLSSKPTGVYNYSMDKLCRDVKELVEFVGEDSCYLVGHDWGAAVAWATPMFHPEVVSKLAICNVPHPARFAKALRTFRQLRKSWYMFFFQIPFIPERYMNANDHVAVKKAISITKGKKFSEEDKQKYVEAASQPGAATGAINYYRAAFRSPASFKWQKIECPTMVVWGTGDPFLGEEMAEPSPKWVPDCTVHKLPGIGHWVQNEAPEEVNQHLLEFFG